MKTPEGLIPGLVGPAIGDDIIADPGSTVARRMKAIKVAAHYIARAAMTSLAALCTGLSSPINRGEPC